MIDPEMDTVLGSTGARLLPYMLAFWFPQGPRYIKQMSPAFSFHGKFQQGPRCQELPPFTLLPRQELLPLATMPCQLF